MSQNTGVAGTGVVAIIFVNTKLETFGVNIISYSLIADESIDFDMVKVSVDSYSNVIRIASHFQYEEPD